MIKRLKSYLQPFQIYLIFISLAGLFLAAWGIVQIPSYEQKFNFILLLGLVVFSQLATTSVPVSQKAGITYSVSPAISLASLPFFGPAAASVIEVVSSFSLWLFKPTDHATWRKSWRQLAFNSGMSSISIYVAGWLFLQLRNALGADTILGQTVPWLFVAITYQQINFWLLMVVLRLQGGKEIQSLTIWRENLWTVPLSILLLSVGGGILAYAMNQFDWIGIIIFFLPIILSAYAFRLYVNQMKAHMDNLENIVTERTRELADLMKEKDQFLAVLTHDMKTPLTSIGIYASLIKDHPHLVTDKPHMTEVILRSQESLTDMVNNILDLEKLQVEGSMQMEKQRIDIALLIEATIEPLKAQALDKEIDLQYKIESRPMVLEVDPNQIKRVIQNLVSNAIKYTPNKGQVCVRAHFEGETAVIQVQDTGYGIPEDELPHVFDRYRRVAKLKKVAAGTGLGLAIAQAIVEAHNGKITVTSQEHVGSVFTIILPV